MAFFWHFYALGISPLHVQTPVLLNQNPTLNTFIDIIYLPNGLFLNRVLLGVKFSTCALGSVCTIPSMTHCVRTMLKFPQLLLTFLHARPEISLGFSFYWLHNKREWPWHHLPKTGATLYTNLELPGRLFHPLLFPCGFRFDFALNWTVSVATFPAPLCNYSSPLSVSW